MPRIGNVEVSDDIVNSLSRAEAARAAAAAPRPGMLDVLGAAAQNTFGQLRYGLPYQAAKLTGNLTPEAERSYQQGLADTAAAAGATPAASVEDLTSGKVGFGRFIGENLAASLPYMAGSLVGGLAGAARGGTTGAVIGAIAGGAPQFSASNVARAVEESGALSDQSAARALAVAPFQSAADAAIARFLPGAGKVLGDMAATQTGGFLRRTATSMVQAAGTEAVTEAAQQVAERYAAGIPVSDADAAGEYVNAAVTAFALGGVLGAGGGFRRTNAVAKPGDMVTNEDIQAHVDGVLDGSLRALPSPEMVGRTAQGPQIEVGASAPIEMENPTDFIVDSAGRVVRPGFEGEQAIAIDRNLPQPAGPTAQELLARFQAATAQPEVPAAVAAAPGATFDGTVQPPATDASIAALTGAQPGATPVVDVPPAARPFAGVDIADLNKARKAKNADPAIVTAIDEEIAARKAEDPFSGVPMNQDIAKLRNATPEERVAGVIKLLEEGDARTGTLRLAERLGIDLSAPAAPQVEQQAPAVTGVTSEPAAPSPVTPETTVAAAPAQTVTSQGETSSPPRMTPQVANDPTFVQQWEELKKAAGIQRMRSGADVLAQTPANLEQARAQVFQALGNDTSNAEVSQVEKMAKQMGLVTNDDAMDITPLGRQAYLSTSQGLEETVLAARQQGYDGAQASIFDRGVRAQLAGQTAAPTFSNFSDMAAYEAGQVWARDFVENAETRTAAQTEAIRARQEARATGTPVDRPAARLELSPQQVQQQALNRLLDAADLRGVGDIEVAALRRMVRNGVTPDELGTALQNVQGGQSLFRQTPTAPVALSRPEGRGQPVFKEMDTAPADPQKAQQRAESEAAVQAYDVRNLIEFARVEGGITEARAARLHDLLDRGKVDQVRNSLKAFDPDAQPARRLPRPPERVEERKPGGPYTGGADAAFEAAITGKDFNGVIDHMIEAAPSRYHREVMRKVKGLADQLRKNGVELGIQIVRPGDIAPVVLNNPSTRAFTVSRLNPPSSQVYLKASEMGEASGTNYQLAAHELLHAVTDRLVDYGTKNPDSAMGKNVKDLIDLGNAIISHFNQRAADGNLNDFEKAYFQRNTNALANAHEILAWGMTNPDMQRYLQSIEYKPRQSVFGRMVELLRKLLGIDGKYDTALTELLRVSEKIMAPGRNDLRSAYVMNNPEGFDTAEIESPATEAAGRTAADVNGFTSELAGRAGQMVENLNLRDLGARARRTALGWLSHNQIDRQYGEAIPAVVEHSDAHRERVAIRSRFEQMGEDAYQAFEQLEKGNPKAAERVGQLMASTTEFQIDPEKTWEQHTWLQNDPNLGNLKRLHGEAVKLKNDLRRGDGAGWASYQNFRALNEAQNYARMAVGLHGLVATDPELSMGIENSWANPADQFVRAEGLGTAQAIRDHWSKALDDQVAAATAFVREKKGQAAQGSQSDQRAMSQHLSPIEMQINAIYEAKAAMAKSPYFHLGRFGDNFGSAVIRKGADGQVDPQAQAKVAAALEKAGFGDAQISTDSTKPRFMLRFDTVDQAMRFRQVALQLQAQGLLDADGEIKVGPRQQVNNFGTAEGLPQFVSAYIQNLEASPMFAADDGMSPQDRATLEKLKQDTIQLARDTWIEAQPDNSISKMLVKRNTIPGYNKDMIRNFAHRWRVGSINIANVASAPKFNKAFTNMKAQYNDALIANKRDADGNLLPAGDPFTVQDVTSELKMRDARTPVDETSDTFDKLRAYAHSYFLGFSPAYAMINTTQLGVTALPELAKKHGYGKSFHAMRRAGAQALAIVKAAGAEARKLGPQHWGDVAITEQVLKNAGLDEKTRDFMRHMLATGTIDIGSMARSLGQVADNKGVGGKTGTYLKWSSALGLYTETFSRLVTALAARDLHGGFGAEAQAYAAKTVSESMFDYQNWNTARQLGKKGFLGPVTPLLTQFMSYQAQITEKLYSETLDAFAKQRPGETAEAAKTRKTEARRFILGHLAAVTTLAGTMGLPFATVFAAAIERIVDAADDDDEPFDATSAYRNFVSEVFGKDVGEVLARGAPRALGFDISSRAGEQNLLPFSEFLADRRSWKEAVANTAGRSLGAVPSMLQNVLEGGGQIADGDLIGGMKTMLPVAFKSPIETYRMSDEGYIDSKGNKLPMTPTASAYLWQLLGFAPAAKAEYGEARGDQAARRGEITRTANTLRQGIVRALRTGDQDQARELIGEAMKFDQDNPAFAVIPSIAASFERQSRAAAQSQAFSVPTGVSMRDIAGQQMTGYANF